MGGLIYAVIVAMWAAYLIPLLLRRHDEMSEARSVDRFSRAMRVLARRTPRAEATAARRDASSGSHVGKAGAATAPADSPGQKAMFAAPDPGRLARRRQRRRRQRLLLALAGVTVVSAGLALLTLLPPWPPLVFAVLVVLYLVHLRSQARRAAERDVHRRSLHARVAGRARRVDSAERVVRARQVRDRERAGTGTPGPAALPAPDRVVPSHPDELEDGAKWEPVPLTLPTYVTKPRAPVIQRVLHLTRPGSRSARHGLEQAVGGERSEGAGTPPDADASPATSAPPSREVTTADVTKPGAATTSTTAEKPYDAQGEDGGWDRRAVND